MRPDVLCVVSTAAKPGTDPVKPQMAFCFIVGGGVVLVLLC
jgi:hypothetical protein